MVKFLIAEYCRGPFFMGWHIYLRESRKKQECNADGNWGWLRRTDRLQSNAHEFLQTLGITVRGDGSCDDDGYAEIARRFPIPRERVGGKPRGCIPVTIDRWGHFARAEVLAHASKAAEAPNG